MKTKEILDKIFKDPSTKYKLTEFENLGKPIHQIITIYSKAAESGKDAGKTKYFLKSFIPFATGNEEVQVYVEGGKSAPEEIVRQLWAYKLIHQYDYKSDEIDLEKSVQFGTEIGTKAADIIVYTDATKETPKIMGYEAQWNDYGKLSIIVPLRLIPLHGKACCNTRRRHETGSSGAC
jgi:type I restriction enzyme M protein